MVTSMGICHAKPYTLRGGPSTKLEQMSDSQTHVLHLHQDGKGSRLFKAWQPNNHSKNSSISSKPDRARICTINSLISLRSQVVDHISKESFVVDDPNFKVKENEDASHSDSFLSTQQVRELMNNIFDMPSGPDSVQDVGVSQLMDVDQPSLVKNVLDDVHMDSVVKDVDESDVKTVVVPFQRQKYPSKACLSPVPSPSTKVKCKKRHREMKLKKPKRVIRMVRVEIKSNCCRGKRQPNDD
ncbi:hypothetical protein Tco_0487017 [Tanacetum coccineum]